MPNDELSATAHLLSRIDHGDKTAIDVLLAQHREYLKRVIEFQMEPMLRLRVDPSDVVQETQLEVVQRIGDYLRRRPMSFRVWLRKTACQRLGMLRRFHLRSLRRSVRREISLPDASSILIANQLANCLPSRSVEDAELAASIRVAMAQLAKPDCEILILRFYEQLTNQESAEALGIDSSAASKRLGRALKRLKDKLTEFSATSQT